VVYCTISTLIAVIVTKKTVSCCHKLTKTATLSCWEEGGGLCPEDANSNTLSYIVTEMVSLACIKPITGLKDAPFSYLRDVPKNSIKSLWALSQSKAPRCSTCCICNNFISAKIL